MSSHTDDVIILCRKPAKRLSGSFYFTISDFPQIPAQSLPPPHINIGKFKGYDNFPSREINEDQINKVASQYSLLTHDHKSDGFLIDIHNHFDSIAALQFPKRLKFMRSSKSWKHPGIKF